MLNKKTYKRMATTDARNAAATFGACSGLCCSTVWSTCMLLGFLALDNSLKITSLTIVARLSLFAFSSSL